MSEIDPVAASVEAICATGCSQVRVVIEALANGDEPAEVAGLDAAQTREVLAELRSIMAVYDEAGSCPIGPITP